MNKKLWTGFIVVFIVMEILEYLIHSVLLASVYNSPELAGVFRPAEEMPMWVMIVTALFFSFFFTLIFSKGYEGKGIMEGVRYGLYVGLMVALPMGYNSYAVYPITYGLAFQWFLYGTIETVILGVVLALVYGAKPKEAAAA